jgi:hypothetical protein
MCQHKNYKKYNDAVDFELKKTGRNTWISYMWPGDKVIFNFFWRLYVKKKNNFWG